MANLTVGGKGCGHVIGLLGPLEVLHMALGALRGGPSKTARTVTLKAIEGSMPAFESETSDSLVVPCPGNEPVPCLCRMAVATLGA